MLLDYEKVAGERAGTMTAAHVNRAQMIEAMKDQLAFESTTQAVDFLLAFLKECAEMLALSEVDRAVIADEVWLATQLTQRLHTGKETWEGMARR